MDRSLPMSSRSMKIEYRVIEIGDRFDSIYAYMRSPNRYGPAPLRGSLILRPRIKHFYPHRRHGEERQVFFIATRGQFVVGAAKILIGETPFCRHPDFSSCFSFVTVDPMYQGHGIGGRLVEMVSEYSVKHDLKLVCTGFTEDGYYRLRKKIQASNEKFGSVMKFEDKIEYPIRKSRGPSNGDYRTSFWHNLGKDHAA